MGKRIPADNAMIPWLVQWAGDVVQQIHVRNGGRMAYEDMTNHGVEHLAVGFGEDVQFKTATDKQDQDKYDGEWDEGYFVGIASRSSEYDCQRRPDLEMPNNKKEGR